MPHLNNIILYYNDKKHEQFETLINSRHKSKSNH